MKQLISKLRAAMTPAPQVVPAQAHVILTSEGLMVSHAWPEGRFSSFSVQVPGAQGAPGQWAIGRPLSLSVVDAEDGKASLMMCLDGGQDTIHAYTGNRVDVEQTGQSIQWAWMAVNANASQGAAAASQAVAPPQQWAPLQPATNFPASPYHGSVVARSRFNFFTPWLLVPVLAVAVVGASWFAASHYLKPSGPGIDLSSMSIDEVALLDANPAAVRQVQDSLIEAVGAGRAAAAGAQAKVEQDHIEALKAMGLDPGVSMKNAMSCLAK
jgi:hypothetical protein